MDFTLKPAGGPDFQFPVNPEEVAIRREKHYDTINIISLGEFDIPKGEKVKEIAFSSFFPRTYDPSYCRYPDIPDPKTAMDLLTTYMNRKTPLRLIIADEGAKVINALVMLSAHASQIRGGEPGDIYFEVTFRTWRDMKVRTAPTPSGKASSGEVKIQSLRTDTKPVPKVYIVKPGDSLSAIAKRELGSSSKWSAIYQKNKALIGKDPNLIRPGQKLVMP